MKKAVLVIVAIVLPYSVFAEDSKREEKNSVFHLEDFIHVSYIHNKPNEFLSDDNYWSMSLTTQLARGSGKWIICRYDCDKFTQPRFSFLGVGLEISGKRLGHIGLRFPFVDVRIWKGLWLGTAVSIWPWAQGQGTHAFSVGLGYYL